MHGVIHRGLQTLKSHLTKGYGTLRHFATQFDRGLDVAKRVAIAAHPVLSDIAPDTSKKFYQQAGQAYQSYDELRKTVHHADATRERLVGSLRKRVPELGL